MRAYQGLPPMYCGISELALPFERQDLDFMKEFDQGNVHKLTTSSGYLPSATPESLAIPALIV